MLDAFWGGGAPGGWGCTGVGGGSDAVVRTSVAILERRPAVSKMAPLRLRIHPQLAGCAASGASKRRRAAILARPWTGMSHLARIHMQS